MFVVGFVMSSVVWLVSLYSVLSCLVLFVGFLILCFVMSSVVWLVSLYSVLSCLVLFVGFLMLCFVMSSVVCWFPYSLFSDV